MTTATEPRIDRMRKVFEYIKAHPEEHDQDKWCPWEWIVGRDYRCGYAYCFAGHTVRMFSKRRGFEWADGVAILAQMLLRLTDDQAEYLFDPFRTLSEIEVFIESGCEVPE